MRCGAQVWRGGHGVDGRRGADARECAALRARRVRVCVACTAASRHGRAAGARTAPEPFIDTHAHSQLAGRAACSRLHSLRIARRHALKPIASESR
eukprot:6219814-Prymnesium_polylepis.1